MFRSHGTDTPREIWNFGNPGEPYYDAIEQAIRLRYSLMPYLYSIALRVVLEDYTMMRGLMFDFPHDKKALEIDDQFMFGDALLVCPVTKPMQYDKSGAVEGAMERVCYLPKGCKWHDYYSGTTYEGGQSVDVPSKLSEIPLFVKAGSILLTQQPTMFAQEDAKALELRIFAGADGTCVYYQDDGISYAYETGAYEEIRFFWNDEAQQLTIREVKKLRNAPIPMIIYWNHSETMIRYDGGEKCISLY